MIKLGLKSILIKKYIPHEFEVDHIEISRIFTPYPEFFKFKKPRDIYSGNENLSFEKRHPKFKEILLREFR